MSKDSTKIVSFGQIDVSDTQKNAKPDFDALPVLPMRDMVVFPGVTFPVALGREQSVKVARLSADHNIPVGIFCQRDAATEDPDCQDLYPYGVVADVLKIFTLPDGTNTAIITARGKVRIVGHGPKDMSSRILTVKAKPVSEVEPRKDDVEFEVLMGEIRSVTRRLTNGDEELLNVENVTDPIALLNIIATHSPFPPQEKMEMLAKRYIKQRATLLLQALTRSEELEHIREEITKKAKVNIDRQQRNMFLQHQYDVLREELYGANEDEVETLVVRAAAISLPEEARKVFDREIEKLRRINQQAPDYSVLYSYLEYLLDLPWDKLSEDSSDFVYAEEALESDHYGLDKVKERILEQIALLMNTRDKRAHMPIICLVGAPGVGKTSLGQSIAKALRRQYRRVSLGGLHDEAEIRGHRRTYIGAMPGRIIDAVKKTGTSNPVILLDEIDKTGNDYKGDPSSALLEVLDPEQNCRFHDNYVDVDFDLSNVLFIATANTLSTIQRPLLDRMEIIEIPGYMLEEKVEIAVKHLLPRILVESGFEPDDITVTRPAIVKVIESYTAESGVRELEKKLRAIVRKQVLAKMKNGRWKRRINPADIRELLGVEIFTPDRYETLSVPGVATGLAWTSVGGEILFIESTVNPDKAEKFTTTGNLGDVMKESALLAFRVVKSKAEAFGVDPSLVENARVHLHVPEGAIPKDGPSAGITMCVSLMSAFTGIPVREKLAMTGEITLRGKVLPVGGIKEKILAAKRAGITDVLLSNANTKDVEDIRPEYLKGMTFHYVENIDEVLKFAIPKP